VITAQFRKIPACVESCSGQIFLSKKEFADLGNCCSCTRVVADAYLSVPDGLFVELDAFETGPTEEVM